MNNNLPLPDEAFHALNAYNEQNHTNYSFGTPVDNFEGGFGKVFNLEGVPSGNAPMVVKVIDTFSRADSTPYEMYEDMSSELRAGKMLSGLGSPYIVPFTDGFFSPNYYKHRREGETYEEFYSNNRVIFLIFMPKFESAAVFFSRTVNLCEANMIKLAYDLSCGLALLNTLGIVHRDISPDNVFVLPGMYCSFSSRYENVFSIGDFGSSYFLVDKVGVKAFFKPDYVPPEQMEAMSENGIINYTDLYPSENNGDLCSLGKTVDAIISAYQIPICAEFRAIIDKATDSDKSRRYPNAEAMKKDLAPLLSRTDWPISSSASALCRKLIEEQRFSEADTIAANAGAADTDCMRARLYTLLFREHNDAAFQGLCELEENDLRSKCLVRLYVLRESGNLGRVERALEDLREAAETGLSAACFDYGVYLLEGVNTSHGVSIPPAKDKSEGCRFIMQAALSGSALARKYIRSHGRVFEKAIRNSECESYEKAFLQNKLTEFRREAPRSISLISNRADSYL